MAFWCLNQTLKGIFRGFPTRMVYLYYLSCLRYTILVGNPRFDIWIKSQNCNSENKFWNCNSKNSWICPLNLIELPNCSEVLTLSVYRWKKNCFCIHKMFISKLQTKHDQITDLKLFRSVFLNQSHPFTNTHWCDYLWSQSKEPKLSAFRLLITHFSHFSLTHPTNTPSHLPPPSTHPSYTHTHDASFTVFQHTQDPWPPDSTDTNFK